MPSGCGHTPTSSRCTTTSDARPRARRLLALEIQRLAGAPGSIHLQHHGAVAEQTVALHGAEAFVVRGHFQDVAIPFGLALEPGFLDGGFLARVGGEAGGHGLVRVFKVEIVFHPDVTLAIVDRDRTRLDGGLTM